jgi:hypothetical protein
VYAINPTTGEFQLNTVIPDLDAPNGYKDYIIVWKFDEDDVEMYYLSE